MSYRIRVFDSRIHAMSLPGGDIYQWTKKVGREVHVLAVALAPFAWPDYGPGHVRGHLKASHKTTVRPNQYGVFCNVSNSAHYARYVHEGTRAAITPTTWPYMVFSINGRQFHKRVVRGQRSQPWLADAQVRVLARHGIT